MKRSLRFLSLGIVALLCSVPLFAQYVGIATGYSGDGQTFDSYIVTDASEPYTYCRYNGNYTSTCNTIYHTATMSIKLTDQITGSVLAQNTSTVTGAVGRLDVSTPMVAGPGPLDPIGAETNVVSSCPACGGCTFLNASTEEYIEFAYTQFKTIGLMPSGCAPPDIYGIIYCEYAVVSHCTPDTTPPDWNGPTEDGIKNYPDPPPYWNSWTFCARPSTLVDYTCNLPLMVPTNITLQDWKDEPFAVCSKH